MITQDILHYLIVEDSVVIYKFNPVNAYLKPLLEKIFEPFISLKLLSVVKGDKDVGRELISKKDVDIIHFTGSAYNYQSVRETSGKKELRTALGNITPLIIPPADWTGKELFQQASHIVFMFTNNSCLNCATPRILITQKRLETPGNSFSQQYNTFFQEKHSRKNFFQQYDTLFQGDLLRIRVIREQSNPIKKPWWNIRNIFQSIGTIKHFPGQLLRICIQT